MRLGGTRGRILPVAVIAAGAAAAYGAGTITHPATIGSPASLGVADRADVTTATRACPSPGTLGETAAHLAAVAVPGSAKDGSASILRLVGTGSTTAGRPLARLARPGVPSLTRVPDAPKLTVKAPADPKAIIITKPGRGGVMVRAAGALAQGLEVEQTSPTGLVSAQCQAPGTSFWFMGPGVASTSQIQLFLMNTDGQPADASVQAITDNGPVLNSTDTGIVVPPHGIVGQPLGKFLHASKVIAVHVTTSVGRVVAAMRVSKASAKAGGWLPVTPGPVRQQIIPGVPGVIGSRVLYLADPGGSSAQVKLTAVTPKGSYRPTGGTGIDLAPGTAITQPLPSLSGVAGAIQITSTAPVVAAVMTPGGVSGAPGAFSAATTPLTEQGIAADNPPGKDGSTQLVISAPRTAATVQVETATAKSGFTGQGGTAVHVAAGHTTTMRVKPPGRGTSSFAILVTPQAGSGPVYVGRVISSHGVVRTILPLTSALTWVALTPVSQALDAVSARR